MSRLHPPVGSPGLATLLCASALGLTNFFRVLPGAAIIAPLPAKTSFIKVLLSISTSSSYAPKSFFFCVAATPKAPEKPPVGMLLYLRLIYSLRLVNHVSGGSGSTGGTYLLNWMGIIFSKSVAIISPQFRNGC